MKPRNRFTSRNARSKRGRGSLVWGIALAAGLLVGVAMGLGPLWAQTPAAAIRGRVVNGTTQRPVPSAAVSYVQMTQGTTPLAQATTDREGRFQLQGIPPATGPAPALLRVEYQGVTYSHPLLPGQSPTEEIEIQVFEGSRDPQLYSVREQAILLHPSGETLLVLEQIILENRSNPPRSYVNPEGTYRFTLPKSARSGVQVTVQGPGGMPIGQAPVPQAKENSFAVSYPIRPGETQFRLEYSLDYRPPFDFEKPIDMAPQQTHIVTPGKEVEVKGEGLVALPADPASGMMGYRLTPVGNVVRLQVTGQAPVQEGSQVAAEGEGGGSLTPVPPPIARQRWLVLAAAGLVMLGGLVYLYKR